MHGWRNRSASLGTKSENPGDFDNRRDLLVTLARRIERIYELLRESAEPPHTYIYMDNRRSCFTAKKPVYKRYALPLTLSDIVQLLGLSEVTVKRHWRYARAWLHQALTRDGDGNPFSQKT
jgi:hypothetical protein